VDLSEQEEVALDKLILEKMICKSRTPFTKGNISLAVYPQVDIYLWN
jgi:hypothetical protein